MKTMKLYENKIRALGKFKRFCWATGELASAGLKSCTANTVGLGQYRYMYRCMWSTPNKDGNTSAQTYLATATLRRYI